MKYFYISRIKYVWNLPTKVIKKFDLNNSYNDVNIF